MRSGRSRLSHTWQTRCAAGLSRWGRHRGCSPCWMGGRIRVPIERARMGLYSDGVLSRWITFRSSISQPNKVFPGFGRLGRPPVAAAAPGRARPGVDRDGRGAGPVDVRAPGARVDVAQLGRPLAPKPPPLQLGDQVGVAHFGQIEKGHAARGMCSMAIEPSRIEPAGNLCLGELVPARNQGLAGAGFWWE